MSSFDSLRYPVGFPPTEEEFSAVPADLFHSWAIAVGWGNKLFDQTRIQRMVVHYRLNGRMLGQEDIILLQRMIYELA